MQYHWLIKENHKRLIVFFSGWSFDYVPFEAIPSNEYDVLMFYDYNDLELTVEIPADYQEKILICWSMGVYAAYLLRDKLPSFSKKIAINGTPYPIDNEFGIPGKTFDLTLKHAAAGLKDKFYKNVFANEELFNRYSKTPVKRSIENRVDELESLYKLIKTSNIKYDNKFYDYAIVGDSDKIIPVKNQLNMWKDKAVLTKSGHFVFYNYNSWDEICR